MSKLLNLNEIELETLINPNSPEDCKFSQKSQKCWSMLIVKRNIWVNFLYRRHLEEFKNNPEKKWKVIELKTPKGVPYNWIEGLDRIADEEEI